MLASCYHYQWVVISITAQFNVHVGVTWLEVS